MTCRCVLSARRFGGSRKANRSGSGRPFADAGFFDPEVSFGTPDGDRGKELESADALLCWRTRSQIRRPAQTSTHYRTDAAEGDRLRRMRTSGVRWLSPFVVLSAPGGTKGLPDARGR